MIYTKQSLEIQAEKEENVITQPEDKNLVLTFISGEKIYVANFSFEYSIFIKILEENKFFGYDEKIFEIKPCENVNFLFIKELKTWFITK